MDQSIRLRRPDERIDPSDADAKPLFDHTPTTAPDPNFGPRRHRSTKIVKVNGRLMRVPVQTEAEYGNR